MLLASLIVVGFVVKLLGVKLLAFISKLLSVLRACLPNCILTKLSAVLGPCLRCCTPDPTAAGDSTFAKLNRKIHGFMSATEEEPAECVPPFSKAMDLDEISNEYDTYEML
jgi:hypothetical protein